MGQRRGPACRFVVTPEFTHALSPCPYTRLTELRAGVLVLWCLTTWWTSRAAVRRHCCCVTTSGTGRTCRRWTALRSPLREPPTGELAYDDWRGSFGALLASELGRGHHRGTLVRAIDDLRALLSFTPAGLMPAVAVP